MQTNGYKNYILVKLVEEKQQRMSLSNLQKELQRFFIEGEGKRFLAEHEITYYDKEAKWINILNMAKQELTEKDDLLKEDSTHEFWELNNEGKRVANNLPHDFNLLYGDNAVDFIENDFFSEDYTQIEQIDYQYAVNLLKSVDDLKKTIGPIPKDFMEEENNGTVLNETDINIRHESILFDVNKFSTVFDLIKLKTGKILDYAYSFGGIGGEPCIYSRDINGKKLSIDEYCSTYEYREDPYLGDLMLVDRPEAFFQLAVFTIVVHQFYLYWHANYNDNGVILGEASTGFSSTLRGAGTEAVKTLNHVSYIPEVKRTGESILVKYISFSKWGGMSCEYVRITLPKIRMRRLRKLLIPYHCGICF